MGLDGVRWGRNVVSHAHWMMLIKMMLMMLVMHLM